MLQQQLPPPRPPPRPPLLQLQLLLLLASAAAACCDSCDSCCYSRCRYRCCFSRMCTIFDSVGICCLSAGTRDAERHEGDWGQVEPRRLLFGRKPGHRPHPDSVAVETSPAQAQIGAEGVEISSARHGVVVISHVKCVSCDGHMFLDFFAGHPSCSAGLALSRQRTLQD